MKGYPKSDYDLIDIKISTLKNKKYDAFIVNKMTGKIVKIPFGQRNYQHFRDTTHLKHYSHLDHNDENRKSRYLSRFERLYDPKEYSPTYFSHNYLWN